MSVRQQVADAQPSEMRESVALQLRAPGYRGELIARLDANGKVIWPPVKARCSIGDAELGPMLIDNPTEEAKR